ncbi:MAG: OmpH family outer membrane protein [Dysgonamonadaceae bacterium]|nr:OmpH family outer membrane protein [Dysgonamonadaceae bacterium]
MVRKFFLLTLFVMPAALFAQEAIKVGYINTMEVMSQMPEVKLMNDSIQRQVALFQSTIKELEDEYTKKQSDFVQMQDSLPENIKILKYREIQSISERAEAFQQDSQQRLQELQQRLLTPIQEKFKKALEEVGIENHFSYVLDANAILYVSPQSTNVAPLVKAKLGLK